MKTKLETNILGMRRRNKKVSRSDEILGDEAEEAEVGGA